MSKCLGCGAELQNVNPALDGYVEDMNFQICHRCFIIKNYGQNKSITKTNIDYMQIINNIRDNDIVVYVSSLLTVNLDYIDKFKNVLLVLTKRDILPKSVKDGKIINYIRKKYDNVKDVIVVSAYKKYNLDCLYNKLKEYKNRNIYFVGITNSGKSTLLNELIKSYNGLDGNITTSNFPSTTLGIVEVSVGELTIKDTPGIVIENSIVNYLDNKCIKKVNTKKEIKPITMQIHDKGAVLIDELFRIEYETQESSMTFYMSNSLNIDNISLKNPRLLDGLCKEIIIEDNNDLVIEDIGFVKFTKKTKIKIYLKYDVYMYTRDKLI